METTNMISWEQIGEVEVINVCTVLEVIFGKDFWSMPFDVRPSYDLQCKAVKAWCEASGADYYCADRENFSLYVARSQAFEKGLHKVVVEDLS
jgi:hypothetical protein